MRARRYNGFMGADITPEEAVVKAFTAWRRVEDLVAFATPASWVL